MKRQTAYERIDDQGRRVGYLAPDELLDQAVEVFGEWGWQAALSRGTGISLSSIQRYLRGTQPVPLYLATILMLLLTNKRRGIPVPEIFLREELGDVSMESERSNSLCDSFQRFARAPSHCNIVWIRNGTKLLRSRHSDRLQLEKKTRSR